jgi:hypothetical protein
VAADEPPLRSPLRPKDLTKMNAVIKTISNKSARKLKVMT